MIRMSLKLDSMILHQSVEVQVALPSSVLTLGKKFTAVWALHCAMATGDLFFERLGMLDYAEKFRLALIAPSLPNTFFVNSPMGLYGDFLDCELYPMLMDMLPLSDKREDHLALGVSMGAYGVLAWALRKPDFFSKVIAVSGYYDGAIPCDPKLKSQRVAYGLSQIVHPFWHQVFKADPKTAPSALESLMRDFDEKEQTGFMFYTGSEDLLTRAQTQAVHKKAEEFGLQCTYREVVGMHDPLCWALAVRDAMLRSFT